MGICCSHSNVHEPEDGEIHRKYSRSRRITLTKSICETSPSFIKLKPDESLADLEPLEEDTHVKNINNSIITRKPNSIRGHAFNVDNCENARNSCYFSSLKSFMYDIKIYLNDVDSTPFLKDCPMHTSYSHIFVYSQKITSKKIM